MQSEQTYIYWEKQGSDRLCGVHCINSLLQGPFFDEIQLSNIALELDQQEKNLMLEQGSQNQDYINYMKEGSNNVADDGNYSIQVLSEGLKQYNLTVESVDKEINKGKDLSQEVGFICNSQSHWFAIRKIKNKFYNLNSTNDRSPQIISDFYLSAFLMSIKENGYTIFVIKGIFPESSPVMFQYLQKFQRFFTEQELQKFHEQDIKVKNHKLNIDCNYKPMTQFLGGTDERDLEKAIEESKKLYEKGNNIQDMDVEQELKEGEVEEEKPKFNAFQGQGVSMQQDSQKIFVNYQRFGINIDPNEDPELQFVLNMTLKDELQKKFQQRPTEGYTICFRMPSGKKCDWVFPPNALIEDLYDFSKFQIPDNEKYEFYLSQQYPKKIYTDVNKTLEQEEIGDMSMIQVVQQ